MASSSSFSASPSTQLSSIIPPNKVGRDYMYVRHVDGYHAIMSRHDCSEIRKIFRQELFSSSSFLLLQLAFDPVFAVLGFAISKVGR